MIVRRDSTAQWEVDGARCSWPWRYAIGGRFHVMADSLPIAGAGRDFCGSTPEGTVSLTAWFDSSYTTITGQAQVVRYVCCGDFFNSSYTWQINLRKVHDLAAP